MITVSFNASGKDFYDKELTDIIISTVRKRLIDATKLEIEVTETVLVEKLMLNIA